MAARAALGLLAIAAGLWTAAPAAAHRLAPSLLELRELPSGLFEVMWKQSLIQPRGAALQPWLPEHCATRGDPRLSQDGVSATLRWTADCGARGLVASRLGVTGLRASGTAALLRVELADGRRLRKVLDADAATFVVPERESRVGLAADYGRMGLSHIASGLDHLLFLLALVLLVRGRRALLWAVSAFTLGHSLTLSLAVLGFLGVSPALAELAIAASLVVLAVELAPGRRSRLARRPWPVAGLFGLVHGLGFAGALGRAGIPGDEIPLALACFNLGIELGQVLFVVAVWWLAHPLRRLAPLPAYVMGSLAAFWCFERAAALF